MGGRTETQGFESEESFEFLIRFSSFILRFYTLTYCHRLPITSDYWQLSQVGSSRLQALGAGLAAVDGGMGSGVSRLSTMLAEADLFFIQRGWMPRRLTSRVDFSICVAPSERR